MLLDDISLVQYYELAIQQQYTDDMTDTIHIMMIKY